MLLRIRIMYVHKGAIMSALHKDLSECYFCGAKFAKDKYGEFTEEVAELWNKKKQDSVLAHVDCMPVNIEDLQFGAGHEEWAMA